MPPTIPLHCQPLTVPYFYPALPSHNLTSVPAINQGPAANTMPIIHAGSINQPASNHLPTSTTQARLPPPLPPHTPIR